MEPEGADDARLRVGLVFADDAEPVFLAQREHEAGEVVVRDAGAELAVDLVGRGRSQREPVDLVDRLVQLSEVEERSLEGKDVVLQALVGAKSRSRGAAEGAGTAAPAFRE